MTNNWRVVRTWKPTDSVNGTMALKKNVITVFMVENLRKTDPCGVLYAE